MNNLYLRLLRLLPDTPTDVGQVVSVQGDGCTVELLTGDTTKVRGQASVDDWVYLRDGAIIGPATMAEMAEVEV